LKEEPGLAPLHSGTPCFFI